MILRTNKDKTLRKKLHKLELSTKQQKYLFISVLNKNSIEADEKSLYLSLLRKGYHRNVSKTKLISRCLLTHKPRVMYKQFKVNRMKLKEMLQMGIIPGYKKSAW